MSINYIIIIVYGNIDMIAKYMPNLKKVSGFEDKSFFKYSYTMNGSWGQVLFFAFTHTNAIYSNALYCVRSALFINGKGGVAESRT